MQSCHLGHLTRTIILGDEDKPMNQMAAPFIYELVKVCPNVGRIKGRLADASVWRAFEETARANWRGLKELLTPEPDHPDHSHGLDHYHELSMANRSTLARIDLPPGPLLNS
ncbi:hypothetical protein RMATCC62417_16922 [Rhizopus microsporus]|nr:hypothetical protein RMATCC62417_16922 [Rhizopus microsporus]